MITNRKSAHWLDSAPGTGLTNFPPEQFDLYEEAVRRFGSDKFEVSSARMVGRGENHPGGSLHYLGDRLEASDEVSAFWDVFYAVQDERKAA